jgi:hypothetical protein
VQPVQLPPAYYTSAAQIRFVEMLRIYWRLYWPAAAAELLVVILLRAMHFTIRPILSLNPVVLIQWLGFSVMFFAAMPRLLRPYRHFQIRLVAKDWPISPLSQWVHHRLFLSWILRQTPRVLFANFAFTLIFRTTSDQSSVQYAIAEFLVGFSVLRALVYHCIPGCSFEIRRLEKA